MEPSFIGQMGRDHHRLPPAPAHVKLRLILTTKPIMTISSLLFIILSLIEPCRAEQLKSSCDLFVKNHPVIRLKKGINFFVKPTKKGKWELSFNAEVDCNHLVYKEKGKEPILQARSEEHTSE